MGTLDPPGEGDEESASAAKPGPDALAVSGWRRRRKVVWKGDRKDVWMGSCVRERVSRGACMGRLGLLRARGGGARISCEFRAFRPHLALPYCHVRCGIAVSGTVYNMYMSHTPPLLYAPRRPHPRKESERAHGRAVH